MTPGSTQAIKVTFVTSSLRTGGAEMMLFKLLQRMDRARVLPSVVSLTGNTGLAEDIRALGVDVVCLDFDGVGGSLNGLIGLLRALRSLNPHVVQGWMVHGNLAASLAGALARKRVYWGVRHSALPAKVERRSTIAVERVLRFLSPFASRIVYNSQAGRARHEQSGYARDKSVVIPNGFDTDVFAPSQAYRASLREELSLTPDAILVGIVGRYHPMKDHRTFLLAARQVAADSNIAKFLLIGAGCNAANPALASALEELQLWGRVALLGERDDMPRLTAALDICTLTSRSGEGFPNAIGEAMAAAVPCVASDVGDCRLIIDDCGIVVPPGNPTAVADAWGRLLAMDADTRRALGERGRRRIVERYSIGSVAREYADLYSASA